MGMNVFCPPRKWYQVLQFPEGNSPPELGNIMLYYKITIINVRIADTYLYSIGMDVFCPPGQKYPALQLPEGTSPPEPEQYIPPLQSLQSPMASCPVTSR